MERVLDVMSWFYRKTLEEDPIFQLSESDDSSDEEDFFADEVCRIQDKLFY